VRVQFVVRDSSAPGQLTDASAFQTLHEQTQLCHLRVLSY
jgi:hypothetical protein